MGRERIDWDSLGPLPPRKKAPGASRDDLAARKFNMGKAKHKGRCHITNQKRRQIAREKAIQSKVENDIKMAKLASLKAGIRAYWAGEADEHP